jgi:molecular chaperone GrpE
MDPRKSERGPAMSLGECQVALAAARQEASELRDKYLRAAADVESIRKRAEQNAAAQTARRLRDFSVRLLEVVDNLERALVHAPQGDALRPGVQATLQQLQNALRTEGVLPIPVAIGAPFDPQVHEAVAGHVADVERETVAEVTQTGYTFDGQLLRPARVVVALPASKRRP